MILFIFFIAVAKTLFTFYSFFNNETHIVYPPTIITFIAIMLAWHQDTRLGIAVTAILGMMWLIAMGKVLLRDDSELNP